MQEGVRPLLEVPAIKPDVAIFCTASRPTRKATCSISARATSTCLMAQAAKHVICSVDRIVPSSTVRHDARLTKIPAAFVDAVVVTPFGAHPGASAGLYEQDEAHLKAYVAASRDQKTFDAYLDSHARAGEDAYRERIGAQGADQLHHRRVAA